MVTWEVFELWEVIAWRLPNANRKLLVYARKLRCWFQGRLVWCPLWSGRSGWSRRSRRFWRSRRGWSRWFWSAWVDIGCNFLTMDDELGTSLPPFTHLDQDVIPWQGWVFVSAPVCLLVVQPVSELIVVDAFVRAHLCRKLGKGTHRHQSLGTVVKALLDGVAKLLVRRNGMAGVRHFCWVWEEEIV
jgi:hypothetical protein